MTKGNLGNALQLNTRIFGDFSAKKTSLKDNQKITKVTRNSQIDR